MFKSSLHTSLILSLLILGMIMCGSCVTSKKSVYFTDIPDTAGIREIVPAEFKEPTIQPDDILSIVIHTIDPQSSEAINQASIPQSSGGGNQVYSNGFLVDKFGKVEIPMLGEIAVAGFTTHQAREIIRSEVEKYYKDPTVQVRFVNYKITVIGEVSKPATYTIPNEKVTILDAIGLAGDLTIYGKRNNVLLIREQQGKKLFVRFDLSSSDIFKSPYFYLKSNDVVYVEPSKGKIAANNTARTQTISVVASLLSLVVVLLTRL